MSMSSLKICSKPSYPSVSASSGSQCQDLRGKAAVCAVSSTLASLSAHCNPASACITLGSAFAAGTTDDLLCSSSARQLVPIHFFLS